MYVKKIYDPKTGAVVCWKTGHTGTHARQNFPQNLVTEGLASGLMSIAQGVLTIRADPEDLRYRIVRGPGHHCCHCGEVIADGREEAGRDAAGNVITRALRHVLDKHAGEKSPDPANPSGVAWLKHYECELDEKQHANFKAQPGDPLTVDHVKRELARKAKAQARRRAAKPGALHAIALLVSAAALVLFGVPADVSFLFVGANQVFNIALGRVAELYNRVDTNDPANSALVVVAIAAGTTTDGQFKDFDTLSACLPGGGGAAEATNTNYARKVLTDADIVAFAPDDTNDRVDLVIPDQTWTGVAAGTNWTDLLLNYDNDTTAGTDANIVPLTLHDFSVTPDGSDITADVPTAGFFRAQ